MSSGLAGLLRAALDIRAKLHCTRCHTLCATCCDGGRM
jgi:hypothetical protein